MEAQTLTLDTLSLQEKLENTLKELEEARKLLALKDDFLNIACHDIRSPLSVIKVCCDYIESKDHSEHSLTPEVKDFFIRINRNNQKALDLLVNLLDIAQLNQNHSLLNEETLEVGDFLEGLIEDILPLTREKNISIHRIFSNKIQIQVDIRRLKQALENIIINAIKFSPINKSITITFFLDDSSSELPELNIGISDQGPGLTKAQSANIFNKFTKFGDSDDNRSGVGLGLNIAKQFIELHQAKIVVESEKRKGTTFWIKIPAFRIENYIQKKLIKVAPMRMLIVEDDRELLEFMRETFIKKNIQVFCAENGKEALNIFEKFKPNIIVSDVKMPDIDGMELLEKIRTQEPRMPFIFMSGYLHLEEAFATSVLQADGIVKKPFSTQEIIDAMKHAFANHCIELGNFTCSI